MTFTLEEVRAVIREEVRAALATAPSVRPLSTKEACGFLKVSRTTLHDWMKSGRIPTRRVHGNRGRLYYHRNELEEAMRRFGRKAAWQ